MRTATVQIGSVKIGGGRQIAIQSMTDTDTANAKATAEQCMELAAAGSELVRITVNSNLAAAAVPEIRKILNSNGFQNLPLIGDFHFNGHILLREYPECAKILDKYRINPGNVGKGDKHDNNFSKIVKIALENNKPIRIGANWGSLDRDLLTKMMNKNAKSKKPKGDKELLTDALVKSALSSAEIAEKIGLKRNKLVLSVKLSIVEDVVKAYRQLAKKSPGYALHLGLTEAGSGMQGLISSTAALSILLNEGIGDTIRISLTPEPRDSRTEEVKACKTLLQALGLRHFKPQITSCPGCGRTESSFFRSLAGEVKLEIDKKMPEWIGKHPGVVKMKIAVMGCVVNGPGESKYADLAISLPGKSEKAVAPIYIKGKYIKSLSGANIVKEFMAIVQAFVEKNY